MGTERQVSVPVLNLVDADTNVSIFSHTQNYGPLTMTDLPLTCRTRGSVDHCVTHLGLNEHINTINRKTAYRTVCQRLQRYAAKSSGCKLRKSSAALMMQSRLLT